MEILEQLQQAVKRGAEEVGPSVVGVGGGWGLGSGVVIAPGAVLTNAHNLRGNQQITVVTAPGRTTAGRVLGVDAEGDIAVLGIEEASPPIAWGTEELRVGIGTPVLALANPGGRGLRVTFGLVSALDLTFRGPRGRRITGSIEHTAHLPPGSSGGPIVDLGGNLLGLNTHRLGEGFYLAIPADPALRERVDALVEGKSPFRARLGIGIVPSRTAQELRRAVGLPECEGVLVRVVEEGGPGAGAGLAQGDLIFEAGGRPVTEIDHLHQALEGVQPGGSLELRVLRGTEERTVTITLGS
ncbi:MAG: S1C family serine protease [Actinomycetota bacterium]